MGGEFANPSNRAIQALRYPLRTRCARESVLAAVGVRSEDGRRAIEAMDVELRAAAHSANPGTTADLTAAAIFVVLLGGAVSL